MENQEPQPKPETSANCGRSGDRRPSLCSASVWIIAAPLPRGVQMPLKILHTKEEAVAEAEYYRKHAGENESLAATYAVKASIKFRQPNDQRVGPPTETSNEAGK